MEKREWAAYLARRPLLGVSSEEVRVLQQKPLSFARLRLLFVVEEMDVVAAQDASKEAVAVASPKTVDDDVMNKTVLYLVKGTETGQPRWVQRALRQNASARKYATAAQVSSF